MLSFPTLLAVAGTESGRGKHAKSCTGVSEEGASMHKIRIEDIASLTDFHRNSTAHCKRLKKSGRPVLLTVNGKALLVVQDAGAYQQLLETVDRARQGNAEN